MFWHEVTSDIKSGMERFSVMSHFEFGSRCTLIVCSNGGVGKCDVILSRILGFSSIEYLSFVILVWIFLREIEENFLVAQNFSIMSLHFPIYLC